MKERTDWAAIAAHADAYAGYPDIQSSIYRERDTGGVATTVILHTVEMADNATQLAS